jgi:putative membrane protein
MSGITLIIAVVFASLAALLHIYIFVMESVLWTRPSTWKRFGVRSQDDAATIRPMALNQGFYNLFLAVGVIVGLLLLLHRALDAPGLLLVFFSCASMLAAALVLVISNPRMARAALVQGLFPLIAVVSLVVVGVSIAGRLA